MASLNQVFIIGRLGRDPELHYSQSGSAICNLNIATDESYIAQNGTRQERTEWHRVTAFQKTAETCGKFLHKGSLVFVDGSLQTRKYVDHNGQDKYVTEIKANRVQFMDYKQSNSQTEATRSALSSSHGYEKPQSFDDFSDECFGPF